MHDLDAMLYVPAGDARKLAKVGELLASTTVIVDLEDAVAADAKGQARTALGRLLDELRDAPDPGRREQLWVRVNAPGTDGFAADVAACARPEVDGLIVPKATVESLETVAVELAALERSRGLAPDAVALLGLIETVAGWQSVCGATAVPRRVHGLSFGAGDFSLELGIAFPPPGGVQGHTLLAAKADLVLHSRRLGLPPPHDGVYPAFRDLDGLRAEASYARAMGFAGKHAIHPDQIPVIRAVFVPGEAELDKARRIVAAAEEAERLGLGNASVDGELVDVPVVRRAEQLLRRGSALHGSDAPR
ncbi:HpcH/HpaI aldolase/citrate lyase family protein [Dactylosporangium sp. CA-092794]|uniref:HpcH/HpaI aldolase/citrate lyase family protein n=1 Tax=Dactylosporangium sp. CA-092794 TaxID=3239929 RepID=UPI003D8FB077